MLFGSTKIISTPSTTLDVPEEEPLSEEEYINLGLIGPAAILASSEEEEIKDE